MKHKFAKSVAVICALLFLTASSALAAKKIPVLESTNGFVIPEPTEVIAFSRLQENWVVGGIDNNDKSWIALLDQKGTEIWRALPIETGGGGDGFITTAEVDIKGILVAGISQKPIVLPTNLASTATPTSAPNPTSSPTITPSKSVPFVNPDNVVPGLSNPLRKDIDNIFLIRINQSGNLENVWNTVNTKGFIPNSIASLNDAIFISGNILSSNNKSKGALYKFDSQGFTDAFSYGENQTTFTKIIAISSKTLAVVGSSADTLAQRKVVGKRDGIILSISPSTGDITKILRSSGKAAFRSWDFASGNLLVAGSSRVGAIQEGVVTSFTSKGALSWTTRFPKSSKTLATGKCVATGVASSDVLIYLIDAKGKQIKAARVPKQDLLALATAPTKECAVLTSSAASGIRLSYL